MNGAGEHRPSLSDLTETKSPAPELIYAFVGLFIGIKEDLFGGGRSEAVGEAKSA